MLTDRWFPISQDTYGLLVFAAGLVIGAALTLVVAWCAGRSHQ